jgi:hypothetical protein
VSSTFEHQKANHVTFDPTFNICCVADLMRAQRRLAPDLHHAAALELLPEHPDNHGRTSRLDHRERGGVEEFYQRYMRLINDYKNMGGCTTVGTDSA